MNRHLLSSAAAALLASAATGCFVGSSGDLHEGAFAYDCTNHRADTACDGLISDTAVIPDRIAVGASFSLEYAEDQGFSTVVDPSVSIVPAAPSILQATSDGFRFVEPGVSAVLGMRDAVVADFIHLNGVALDHLVVQTELHAPVTNVDLPADGSKDIVAIPADADNLPLAGSMSYTWSSSDESVVTVEQNTNLLGTTGENHVTLRAQGAGAATVTVTTSVAGASFQIPVTVGGAP